MRLSFQIVIALYVGLLTIYAGAINFIDPSLILAGAYNLEFNSLDSSVQQAYSTQTRIFSALWVVAGLFVLLAIRNFESQANVIRLVLFGTTLGVVGQLISVYGLGGDLETSLFKCAMAIIICIALEVWRIHLVNKALATTD